MSKKQKMMLVKWRDSAGVPGWRSSVSAEPIVCESCGFLVHSDKNSVVLALSMCNPEESSKPYGDMIVIPTESIVCRKALS